MATQASRVKGVTASSSRLQCWVESLILGLGIPSAIWAVSRLISVSIPAAVHGSPEQRFFWFSAAGFCEEVLFRAYLMTQFAQVGYGKAMQTLIPGLAFGLAHAGYLNQGFLAWLGIVVPTAFLGMMWGLAYLLGRRSLIPVIVAHFLNDATALPWIAFFMVTAR
jgi:membrane protease YdiL (CAAX protease family)